MTDPNSNADQQDVIAEYANQLNQFEIAGYEKTVRRARNALFWAGGLIFLGEMISMYQTFNGFDPFVFAIGLFEAGIFVGLAFWTRKKPYTAVLTGLIAFIVIILFAVVVTGMAEGSTGVFKALFSGIILKIVILFNLIVPLKDARALQAAKAQQF